MKNTSKILVLVILLTALLTCMAGLTASAEETETKFVYLNAWDWNNDSTAWFQAYTWNHESNENSWVTFTQIPDSDYYFAEIPANRTRMIFLRKGPDHGAGTWDCWNRTGDITISADTNCFTITAWNGDSTNNNYSIGSWSSYTFTVAGDSALCGSEWSVTDTSNDMTFNADGSWTKTYTGVAAGSYELKCAQNHAWDVCYGDANGYDNYIFSVVHPNSTVTVTLKGSTVTVDVVEGACSGGTATCTAKATCEFCKEEYGDLAPHSFDNNICSVCDAIEINETTFPDETFRNIILSAEFDMNQDGLLSTEEIARVTNFWLEGRGFTDLTGINYFTELTELDAQNNNFTSLDLSGLTKLESLYLNANPNLESLNLTGCTALRGLYLTSCRNLATLNIQDCVALQYLDLSSCSKLANSFKVGHLTELIYLSVDGIWLRELDLSNNTKLEELIISNTGFTTLDLSNNPEIYRFEGASLIPIKHCGVGYVNLNEFVDDISKILSVTNGTLEDGWVKLDDGATYLFYDYDTGLEGYPLSVKVHLSISNVEHSYVSNITGKDENGHYTEWCETCRTGNEESVTEHTYEEIVRADFAKTPATCTTGTIYYKSCECGRTIEETFEDTDRNSENHTGTNDKLVPNGVLHHDVVWSCCGAVVTENVDCTASNADDSCLTAETCACGNLLIAAKDSHKLTYTASGNVITETCGREGCAHTATATLYAPENPVYNGTQKLATVTYSDDWKGDDLMVGYSGTANDGSSYAGIVYPAVKAGTVTASITAQSDDYTVATANVTYTIEKAPVTVGIVSVESPEAIYPHTALGSIVLTRTNTTIPGTLALNAGQTLTVGTQEYNWTWTPDDANNYKETKGTITITVTKATPTADIFDFTPPTNLNACDGLAKEATVTVKEAIEGVGSVTVKYFKDGVELDGAPTAVGTYTVKIEVAEGANFLASEGFLTAESWTFTFDVTDEAAHANVTLSSNGNGTHNKVCSSCEKVIESNITCSGTTTDDCDKGYKCSCGGYFGTKEHDFSGNYFHDADGHWHECADCGATDTKEEHSGIDDGDCKTTVRCDTCNRVLIFPIDHEFDNACDTDCNNDGCEYTRTTEHIPEADDGDCTTAIHCEVCDAMTTPGNPSHDFDNACDADCNREGCNYTRTAPHTPEADDGNCTTEVKCSVCQTVTTPANEAHTGGTATCQAKANCSVCGTAYGETNANNHSKTTFVYTANADGLAHTKKYECCGVVALDSEAHTYGADNKCVCGAEKPIPTYTVTVENGTASDGNTSIVVNENGSVTVTANAAPEGKQFKGWSVNGTVVSTEQSYTFNATADTTITAVYEDVPKNSGCGSVIGIGSSVIVVALIGLAVIFIRKKRLINVR